MSISRALGAEKPAAKRPRSYMEGFCGRKLSIMKMLSFWGGVKQNKGAHHEHQQRLGGRKASHQTP